jgi:hypothetical protein
MVKVIAGSDSRAIAMGLQKSVVVEATGWCYERTSDREIGGRYKARHLPDCGLLVLGRFGMGRDVVNQSPGHATSLSKLSPFEFVVYQPNVSRTWSPCRICSLSFAACLVRFLSPSSGTRTDEFRDTNLKHLTSVCRNMPSKQQSLDQ